MLNEFKPYIERLRSSRLRPTKQRLTICKILFGRSETFHFTIENLKQIIERDSKSKISLATLYNTVHALKKNGYLKQISLKANQTFFDTNTKSHHHFYDEDLEELRDIKKNEMCFSKVPVVPVGKKIKEIEVVVRIAKDNQSQKNS